MIAGRTPVLRGRREELPCLAQPSAPVIRIANERSRLPLAPLLGRAELEAGAAESERAVGSAPFVGLPLRVKSDNTIFMESHISATDAARSLSDLLNRVRYRGESFIIERGGEAVCRMVPAKPQRCTVADLVRALKSAPTPDADYFDAVEKLTKKQPKLPKGRWGR
jgi:antitoxin (DNA-binding transcriptional repressor) of toxin-antitoxin stability system